MNERTATTPASETASQPELPVVHTGLMGSLHRRTFTTMSVEPGLLDANIWPNAFNADAPQHIASRALL
jgi:hypothetical protein